MANIGEFDARTVAPQAARGGPIPTGEYTAMITDSKEGVSKSSGSKYVELTYQVIDGPHKGAMLWHYLNLGHPSAQTQEIARAQLSSICHAVGRLQITDSQQLHNIPHVIRVVFQKAEPSRGRDQDGNKIMEWKARGAGTPAAGPSNAPPTAAAAPAPAWGAPAPAAAPVQQGHVNAAEPPPWAAKSAA